MTSWDHRQHRPLQNSARSRTSGGITVAYSGVHQAFQIALAAQEAGLLDVFYTSFFNAPGKWGRWLERWVGTNSLCNRSVEVNPENVLEYPWPELLSKVRTRVVKRASNNWIYAAHRFDRWVSRRINFTSRIFVGVENCAFYSFQVARQRGMRLIYDRPGYNPTETHAAAHETARQFRLPYISVGDTPQIEDRKRVEISLADHVLCCSEVHAEGLRPLGLSKEKAVVIPLWVDPRLWFPVPKARVTSDKLRVIYAGAITLRKGIPFLIEAARRVKKQIELTLVGQISDDVRPLFQRTSECTTVIPAVTKSRLRELYCENDVLVLPSLGDSFGFVALEAMACGLPVIVTKNCGVPVPDPSWRIPVMDSEAIARRLELYASDRNALERDGMIATRFAREFTPERYRQQISGLFCRLLRYSSLGDRDCLSCSDD